MNEQERLQRITDIITNRVEDMAICETYLDRDHDANRGIYKIGKDYAVQQKRGVEAESDIRIVIYKIWEEVPFKFGEMNIIGKSIPLSKEDARAEGGYSVEEYEIAWAKLNSEWNGRSRGAFKFRVIEA